MSETHLPAALSQFKKPKFKELIVLKRKQFNLWLNEKDLIIIIFLFFIGILTRVLNIYYPKFIFPGEDKIFDEINKFCDSEFFIPSNLPVVILIYGNIAKKLGYFLGNDYQAFSEYKNYNYVIFRLISSCFSGLCSPLIYLCSRLMDISKIGSVTASLLFVFETSFISQSRYLFVDGILDFFACLTLFFILLDDYISSLLSLTTKSIILGISLSTSFRSIGLLFFAVLKDIAFIRSSYQASRAVPIRIGFLLIIILIVHYFSYLFFISELPYLPRNYNKDSFYLPDLITNSLVTRNHPVWRNRYVSIFTTLAQCSYLMFCKGTKTNDYKINNLFHIFKWPVPIFNRAIFYNSNEIFAFFQSNIFIEFFALAGIIVISYKIYTTGIDLSSYHFFLLASFWFSFLITIIQKNTLSYHSQLSFLYAILLLPLTVERYIKSTLKNRLLYIIIFLSFFGFVLFCSNVYGL